MRKATYADVQTLKTSAASLVSNFRDQFGDIAVKLQITVRLDTRHGKETVGFKLENVPAVPQGMLPGMNEDLPEELPDRRRTIRGQDYSED